MTQRSYLPIMLITIITVLSAAVVAAYAWFESAYKKSAITSFAACAAAGYPVMESYPRQCAANGTTYTEVLTNQNTNSPSTNEASNTNAAANTNTGDSNTNGGTGLNVNMVVYDNTNSSQYDDYPFAELLADFNAGTMDVGTFRTTATIVDYWTDPVGLLVGSSPNSAETVLMLAESLTGYSIGQGYVISFSVSDPEGAPTLISAGQPSDGYNQ